LKVGGGSMHWKVWGGVNTVKTLKFEREKCGGCMTPAPMVAPPLLIGLPHLFKEQQLFKEKNYSILIGQHRFIYNDSYD